MKKKRWLAKEIKFLKENYMELAYDDISKHLGRSIASITVKVSRLRKLEEVE